MLEVVVFLDTLLHDWLVLKAVNTNRNANPMRTMLNDFRLTKSCPLGTPGCLIASHIACSIIVRVG